MVPQARDGIYACAAVVVGIENEDGGNAVPAGGEACKEG